MAEQFTRPPCELISWGEVTRLCRRLAVAINDSGFRPDLVVAIGRGGFVPGRLICDNLGLMDLTSIKVEHYLAGSTRRREARIRYPLPRAMAGDVAGRRVLIVDDVNDSGDTLVLASEHLRGFGAAAVRTAVMHDKTVSRFTVDYYARRIVKWRWIIYPWAVTEDIGEFSRRLSPPPADLEELQGRLRQEHGLRVPMTTLREIDTVQPLLPSIR